MKVSRRNFLAGATGSAVAMLEFPPLRSFMPRPPKQGAIDCAIIDLCSHCALRESLHGYQAALTGRHQYLRAAMLDAQQPWRVAIVPGLASIDPPTVQTLLDLLHAGTLVLLESGAGFLNATQFAFHQTMLRRYFDLVVEDIVDPWAQASTPQTFVPQRAGRCSANALPCRQSIPYVHYIWPHTSIVRDFSRLIPVRSQAAAVIARVGEVPVALKKRVGQGTLIFLGSPMGPLLRAGDLQARWWLEAVTAL